MRKLLLSLMLVLSVPMAAQNWTKFEVKGDELKGTKDHITYLYNEDTMYFQFDEENDKQFIVKTEKSFFNYAPDWFGYHHRNLVMGKVGLYDTDDKLIEGIDLLFEITDHTNILIPNKYTKMGGNNSKRCKKVLDFIKNQKGFVRIVLPLYDDTTDFDLKIPTLQN